MKKLYNLGAWSSHNEAPIQYNIEKFECFISLSSDYFFSNDIFPKFFHLHIGNRRQT